jgi:hypothetical protein
MSETNIAGAPSPRANFGGKTRDRKGSIKIPAPMPTPFLIMAEPSTANAIMINWKRLKSPIKDDSSWIEPSFSL